MTTQDAKIAAMLLSFGFGDSKCCSLNCMTFVENKQPEQKFYNLSAI